MNKFVYYGTFGTGHPGFPGYLEITVEHENEPEAYMEARRRMKEATNNRWCGMYPSLDKVHPDDRVFRGTA